MFLRLELTGEETVEEFLEKIIAAFQGVADRSSEADVNSLISSPVDKCHSLTGGIQDNLLKEKESIQNGEIVNNS